MLLRGSHDTERIVGGIKPGGTDGTDVIVVAMTPEGIDRVNETVPGTTSGGSEKAILVKPSLIFKDGEQNDGGDGGRRCRPPFDRY